MSMLSEFRDFAIKGNVIDLAVAVIIGAAFGKIVDSLVKDIIMPVIGKLFGGLDFTNYFIMLGSPPAGYSGPMTYEALTKAGVPLLAYGNFITIVINFVILAFVIFWMVKQFAKAKAKLDTAPAAPPATPEDVLLLREIRDLASQASSLHVADRRRRSRRPVRARRRCGVAGQIRARRYGRRERRSTSCAPASGPAQLFVVEQAGRIRILRDGALLATPFLDIRALVTFGGEQGLLGLAFHPQYASNGKFYVNYTRAGDGATVIASFRVSAADRDRADPASRSELLTVAQPLRQSQRRRAALRAGRLPVHRHGRRRQRQRSRAIARRTRRSCSARCCASTSTAAAPYAIPPGNPFAAGRRPPRDLRVRLAQSVAIQLRSRHRRPVHRRRRAGRRRGNRLPARRARARARTSAGASWKATRARIWAAVRRAARRCSRRRCSPTTTARAAR